MENHDYLNELTDEQLIREIQAGTYAAFGVLTIRYTKKLFLYLRGKFIRFSDDQCKDIVQDGLLIALINIDTGLYKEEGHFSSYIYGVVRNKAFEIIEQKKKEEAMEMDFKLHYKVLQHVAFLGVSPARLDRAMNQLTEKQRKYVVMHFIKGMSFKEIAKEVDSAEGTVSSTTTQAIEKLRKILNSETDPTLN